MSSARPPASATRSSTNPDRPSARSTREKRCRQDAAQRVEAEVIDHTNIIEAATAAGTARILYTSMLNSDDTTNPLAGEHQETERALGVAGVPFTLLRNGWYTENYTGQLSQYVIVLGLILVFAAGVLIRMSLNALRTKTGRGAQVKRSSTETSIRRPPAVAAGAMRGGSSARCTTSQHARAAALRKREALP
jgi:NmrA-like family